MNKIEKNLLITRRILLIVGILFLIGTIAFVIINTKILMNSEQLVGTIHSIYEETTIVSYYYNNEVFYESLHETSSLYYVGKEIILYYIDGAIYSKLELITPLIVMPLIVVSLLIYPIISYINQYKINKLKKNKDKLIKKEAKVISICLDKKYSINNTHPYVLTCKVNYNGEELILKKKFIWEYIEFKEGYVVNVYFKNKKEYYIDVESYREGVFFEEW